MFSYHTGAVYLKQNRDSALTFLKRSLFEEPGGSTVWKDLRDALPPDFDTRSPDEQHQVIGQCSANMSHSLQEAFVAK